MLEGSTLRTIQHHASLPKLAIELLHDILRLGTPQLGRGMVRRRFGDLFLEQQLLAKWELSDLLQALEHWLIRKE